MKISRKGINQLDLNFQDLQEESQNYDHLLKDQVHNRSMYWLNP